MNYCTHKHIARARMVFITIALLSAMLTLSTSDIYADQGDELPANRFTTEEQRLIDAGFPDVKTYWNREDFNAARDAILAASEKDPLTLPRLTDSPDGLFSRLVIELDSMTAAIAEGRDEPEMTEDIQKYIGVLEISTNEITLPIFGAYSHLQDGTVIVYEREMLSLLPFIVRQMGLMAHVMQEIVASGVELPDEAKSSFSSYRKLSGDVTNAAIGLIVYPGLKHDDLRSKLIIDCEDALKEMLLVLAADRREEAVAKLNLLRTSDLTQEEHASIKAIIGEE